MRGYLRLGGLLIARQWITQNAPETRRENLRGKRSRSEDQFHKPSIGAVRLRLSRSQVS